MSEAHGSTEEDRCRRAVAMFVAATPTVDATIDAWRSGFERLCGQFEIPADAQLRPVETGGVPGLAVAAPGASSAHRVIHFHSGGYVMGSSRAYRNFAYRLSAVTGAEVLVPDYRLAPEHPYPAPVEDALAVYRACVRDTPPSRVVVCGDSAGGGLAIALLMALRDAGDPLPAAGVAISPLLDLAGEGESVTTNHGIDPLIYRDMIVGMGKVYIGELDPHAHPLASPLWGQHHGLPPLFLLASNSEVLRDDATRLAARVRAAGGQVRLALPEGMVHIWTLFPFLRQAGESMAEIGSFVRGHLGLARA